MMPQQTIDIDQIKIGHRRRPCKPEKILTLAESIHRNGILQPVVLDANWELKAGFNRVTAARKAGLTQIPYVIPDDLAGFKSMGRSPRHNKMLGDLAEIDENLIRDDLNALERAQWVAARLEITDELDKLDPAPGARLKTIKEQAEEMGLSARTLQECKQIVTGIAPEVQDMLAGTEPAEHQKQLLQLARIEDADQQKQAAEKLIAGKSIKSHVAQATGKMEWYSPPPYVEAARAWMGSIDLDPASSEIANQIVQAADFYTAKDDGLQMIWRGKVWLNPPYSHPLVDQFSEAIAQKYIAGEIEMGTMLLNNATETDFLQGLLMAACAVCFPDGRIPFLNQQLEPVNKPLQGQVILGFGKDPLGFRREFKGFGEVLFTDVGLELLGVSVA